MAIITLAKTKEILQITVSTYDSLIETLIPEAEGLYLIVRGIPFFEITGDLTSSSAVIADVSGDDLKLIEKNERLESLSSSFAAVVRIESIEDVEDSDSNNVTVSVAATATVTADPLTVYPNGSEYAAAKIIGYMLDKSSATGAKSEKIGNYSYTKFDQKSGLPVDITATIPKYQSMQ